MTLLQVSPLDATTYSTTCRVDEEGEAQLGALASGPLQPEGKGACTNTASLGRTCGDTVGRKGDQHAR